MAKKSTPNRHEARKLRTQQIVFGVISLMIVLAMVLSLFAQ